MKNRNLYDRAQELDRATDALSFKLNGVVDPAERAALQVQINHATQRASDAWAHFHDKEYEGRHGRRAPSGATALATPAPVAPVVSAAEIAERRRAASRALWARIIGRVNAEVLGGQPDGRKTASTAAPAGNSQKSATKSIWSKAIAAANAGIAGGEPRERDTSSNGRRQSGDVLEKAMTAAGKHLANTGFSVAR